MHIDGKNVRRDFYLLSTQVSVLPLPLLAMVVECRGYPEGFLAFSANGVIKHYYNLYI